MTEKLTGIKGPMFSEKTTTLISRVHRAEHAGKNIKVFKPIVDDRWEMTEFIQSHNKVQLPATPVNNSVEIHEHVALGETDFVAIDEAQFFDEQIVDVVRYLTDNDVEVVFSALPLDFKGEPFGPAPILFAMADEIVNLTAICKHHDNGKICGREATRTQRIVNGEPAHYTEPVILIGAEESYEARCIDHHEVPGRPEPKIVYKAPSE